MPHVAYPTDAEIQDRCTALGLFAGVSSVNADALCMGKGDVVSAEWERKVDWDPFLSDGIAEEVRYFDPPGGRGRFHQGPGMVMGGLRVLYFRSGLISLTELRVNVTPTYAGDVRTVDTDFFLEPYNDAVRKTRLRFGWPIVGLPRSISIEGVWGYCTALPDDLWDGLILYGVFKVAEQFLYQFLNQPAEWSEGDIRERLDSNMINTWGDHSTSPGYKAFSRLLASYVYPEL